MFQPLSSSDPSDNQAAPVTAALHFSGVEDARVRLQACGYVATRAICTAVYLADTLGKPLLVEGPPGVGKTELAKACSAALGRELIRLQCYEGLDESKALYEWEYAKQLLYAQILKEELDQIIAGAQSLAEAIERLEGQESGFFSEAFLLPRPLLRAIVADAPAVLLVDEVDRADEEFEAFLLELLSDFQVTIPELGTVQARHIPLVILTSNATREVSDALRRRCLHLFMDFPSAQQETQIVRLRVPQIQERLAAKLVAMVQRLRSWDLEKAPTLSETLDWARALCALGAESLDAELVEQTLGVVLKTRLDLEKGKREVRNLLKA
jgi:MoxR-like ATPase